MDEEKMENVGEEKKDEAVTPRKVERSNMNKFRENPWIVSTIVLAAALILVVAFGGVGYPGSSGNTGNIVSETEAADNLVSFIESQSPIGSEGLEVISSEREGEVYKVTLGIQGQSIPIFITLDGQFLMSDLIPLDPSLLPPLDNAGAGTAGGTGEIQPLAVEIGDSPVKGDENAKVTIVEFSDYECPFCGRFFSDTLGLIEENYIETGKVKLVYKDFPLSIHRNAQKAAEAAHCVRAQGGDDGYWQMHDLLFANQQGLSDSNYKAWARQINGINGAEFDSCLDNGDFASEVLDDFAYGQTLGVTGTPGFIINGQLVSGAQPYSVFEQIIEAELAVA